MSTRGLLQRVCGTCDLYAQASCRHPQAKDHNGKYAGMYRFMANPPPVWPAKKPGDTCGWWRPNTMETSCLS